METDKLHADSQPLTPAKHSNTHSHTLRIKHAVFSSHLLYSVHKQGA